MAHRQKPCQVCTMTSSAASDRSQKCKVNLFPVNDVTKTLQSLHLIMCFKYEKSTKLFIFSGIAAAFLIIINKYIVFLRNEKSRKIADQPPSYIACLVNGSGTRVDEKKDIVFVVEEKKAEPKEEHKESQL